MPGEPALASLQRVVSEVYITLWYVGLFFLFCRIVQFVGTLLKACTHIRVCLSPLCGFKPFGSLFAYVKVTRAFLAGLLPKVAGVFRSTYQGARLIFVSPYTKLRASLEETVDIFDIVNSRPPTVYHSFPDYQEV